MLSSHQVGSSSVSRNSATASEHLFNRNAARVDWRIDNPISDILIDSFGRLYTYLRISLTERSTL